MSRTIVVGDVHGCYVELEELLEAVQYAPGGDRLIFVGDLVNKGPDSCRVLQLLKTLRAEAVVGNHELALLAQAYRTPPRRADTAALIAELDQKLPNWRPWIRTWPRMLKFTLEAPESATSYVVVHAGIAPGMAYAKTPVRLLTQIRTWDGQGERLYHETDPPWFEVHTGPETVIFGHWARQGLVQRPFAWGLDTGCVYGGALTALVLPEQRLVQIPARQTYRDPKNPA